MIRTGSICCLLLLVLGFAGYAGWQWWSQPFAGQQRLQLLIDEGSSLATVAAQLERGQALRHGQLWRQVVRLQGKDNLIRRGEYLFEADQSPADILNRLLSGEVVRHEVTLPEGITLHQAVGLLHDIQPRLSATLSGANDPRLLALAAPHASAEGLFFPDTYQFTRGDTDLDVLLRAHARTLAILEREWSGRQDGLPLTSSYEALILASIVERETGLTAERERIAGVFVRRLQQGMRLQADPTVIYGLGQSFDGNLRRSHLEDASNPYNSYRHFGLPPTPIALPGEAALRAVLHPEAGDAMYFVARGDGSHEFSARLEQHNEAVRRFQLSGGDRYRITPGGP